MLVVYGDARLEGRDARWLRLFAILESLVLDGHRITFVGRSEALQEPSTARLLRLGVLEVFPIVAELPALNLAHPETGWSVPMLDLAGLLKRGEFDVAWLSTCDIAVRYEPIIRQHSHRTRVVVDATDIQWSGERGSTCRAADVNVVVSPGDAMVARELAPDVPVHVVSFTAPSVGAETEPATLAADGAERSELRQLLRAASPAHSPAAMVTSVPPAAERTRPQVAIVVQAADDAPALRAQLDALERALPREGVELVIVAFGHDAESSALLADGHGARVLRCDRVPGTGLARALAVEATSAPMLVTLGPLALPQPGLLEPLRGAVSAGASFAGATVDGAHGLHVAEDGSLWPRGSEHDGIVQALAFDCLAARREIWMEAPHVLPMREGHPERQFAQWAISHGPLVSCHDAIVRRFDAGPISVIVATRNRAEELPGVVRLLVAHGVTLGGGEVIIVDNGSTDHTPTLATELASRHQGVRLIRDSTDGVSHARNTGAAAARNGALCYLDDDARPAPGWRESIAWALSRPGIAAAGGPICALWPATRPPGWPPPGLEGTLSVLDGGDEQRLFVPPEVVYCANWGIRREALWAAGGFDSGLGYAPDRRTGGAEVAVAWQLHSRGIGGTLYVPGATVGHRIPEDRIRDSYLIERRLIVGIENAQLRARAEGTGRERLLAEVAIAARRLFEVLPLSGDLALEEAFAQVRSAAIAVDARAAAAESLGLLAATALLLGEDQWIEGELRLRVRPEHLRGLLQTPPQAS